MKRIAITGYNSFIGNHFYKKYKNKYVIINYKENINNISKFKLFINSKRLDFFVHFAGMSRTKCDKNKKLCKKTNFLSLKKIINQLNDLEHKPRFIFISTSLVYSNSSKKIKESFKKKPKSLYAKLKLNSENYLKENYKKYSILRMFNVYGKKQPHTFFIPDIKKKIQQKKNNKIKEINKRFYSC